MKDIHSKITIVVPFRICNEEELQVGSDFHVFLNSLELVTDFVEEVIFVNDHSVDSATVFLKSFLRTNWRVISLTSEFEGKKEALNSGIQEARTEYIWTLDADVEIRNWKSDLFKKFLNELNEDLVIFPVQMKEGSSFVQSLQTNEWRYMQLLTWFSARLGFPMMCNGANLVFKRNIFLNSIQKHRFISSGDDMFLLSEVLREKGLVRFCSFHYCDIVVSAESSFAQSIHQRLRWAGKTMKIPTSRSTVLHVFFAAMSAVHLLCFLGIFNENFFQFCSYFLVVKIGIETLGVILRSGKTLNNTISVLLPFQLAIYPFFSLFIFITSLFFIPKWKNRRVSLK